MLVPPVLEYARFYGLATDHSADDILKYLHDITGPEPSCPAENDDSTLSDPDFTIFTNALAEPKLQLNKQETVLLAGSLTDPSASIQWDDFLPDPKRRKKMKVEEPLLARDHDMDMAGLRKEGAIPSDLGPLLADVPQFKGLSDEPYENGWGNIQASGSMTDISRKLDLEKMHATREALTRLAEMQHGPLTKEEAEALLSEGVHMKLQLRSSSPPSMLEEPASLHSSPSLSDTEAELPPREEVDLDKLLMELDDVMEDEGCPQFSDTGYNDVTSPRPNTLETQGSPSAQRREDLALGKPSLMIVDHATRCPVASQAPSAHEESDHGIKARATRSSPLSSVQTKLRLLPEFQAAGGRASPFNTRYSAGSPSRPHTVESHEMVLKHDSDDDIDNELLNLAEQDNEKMECRLKQDVLGLSKVQTKIPVPDLDHIRDKCLDHHSHPDFIASHLDMVRLAPLETTELNGAKELQSAIPPKYANLNLYEGIENCDTLDEVTRPPQCIIQSEQMLWTQPGLRIMDEDDDSDGGIQEDEELAAFLSKPADPQIPRKRPAHDKWSNFYPTKKRPPGTQDDHNRDQTAVKYSPLTLPNMFSASSALHSFLDLRGSKFKAIKKPCPISTNEISSDPIEATQVVNKDDARTAPGRASVSSSFQDHNSHQDPSRILVPSTPVELSPRGPKTCITPLKALEWPRTVIIEMSMLRIHRQLVHFLERQGAGQLTMIYRDLSSVQGDKKAPSVGPDMILTPRSALFFTTLQALNQRSLPGQGDSSGRSVVQRRVHRLLQEYDHVFILITGFDVSGSILPTASDTIAQFTGFCSSLTFGNGQCVTPVWVRSQPASPIGDGALNSTTWHLIAQHAFPTFPAKRGFTDGPETVTLIHDETLWELFLRKGGMNAMGAQVVLGMLHRSRTPASEDYQTWGLRRLVQMSAEERIDMFSEILGRSMTEKMNSMLDSASS